MREIKISKNEAGQRLNKFLMKYLKSAPSSFVYKMLRKKNIKLNDAKAEGSELLCEGDNIKLFLSDETIDKFKNEISSYTKSSDKRTFNRKKSVENRKINLDILYIDDDIMAVNKPVGILSQKANEDDYSINEAIIDYVIQMQILDETSLDTFKPSVCNRLDRNTSGIIWAGISLKGSQELTKAFKERKIDKYYYTIVHGRFNDMLTCDGYIIRDGNSLKSEVISEEEYERIRIKEGFDTSKTNKNDFNKQGFVRISTSFIPVSTGKEYTLLKIKLITGKTHQIRAHLAKLGYPVIGDVKYGDRDVNSYMKERYGLKNHLLHAGEAFWKEKNISLYSEAPEIFEKICKGEGLIWQPGTPEA